MLGSFAMKKAHEPDLSVPVEIVRSRSSWSQQLACVGADVVGAGVGVGAGEDGTGVGYADGAQMLHEKSHRWACGHVGQ